jgi:hypothetical protein
MTYHVAIKCATNFCFENATLLYCNFLQNLSNYLKKTQFWQNSLVPQTSIEKLWDILGLSSLKLKIHLKVLGFAPLHIFALVTMCLSPRIPRPLFQHVSLSCQNLGDKPKTMIATFFFQICFHLIALLVILGQVMSSFSTLSWFQY